MPYKALVSAHGRGARDSWRALLELAPHLGNDWILIGGQMVAVYAADQPDAMTRETTDADIVIDLRVSSKGFDHVDRLLTSSGFVQEISTRTGVGHRYSRGHSKFDILSPDNMGSRNPLKLGHGRSVAVRGATRALVRARAVMVEFEGMSALIRIPSPVGALVLKGLALYHDLSELNRSSSRHRDDIITLLECCELSTRELPLSKSERRILKRIAEDNSIPTVSRNKVIVLIHRKTSAASTTNSRSSVLIQYSPPGSTRPTATTSQRCLHMIDKKRRCNNKTTHPSGLCHQHR